MDIKSQHTILQVQLLKKEKTLHAIQVLKLVAGVIILLTIFMAYARPASSTRIFISLLVFLTVQVFATKEYACLAKISGRIRLMLGGSYFPRDDIPVPWKIAAGTAIRDAYFFLLLFFDVSWLAHAYLYPSPANSFSRFLVQLSIGPISGWAFIWFTILLWILYTYLLVIGILYTNEINLPEEINVPAAGNATPGTRLREIWVKVKTFGNDEIYLQGSHLPNPGKQPLILFPGFFQNGFVYHLSEETSLARFLWDNNFDIWIIHPRGTAQSGGRDKISSIDDIASDDIPAIVNYVFLKTGIKPVFVGHSQGGISAIISTMGALKANDATVSISDKQMKERQGNLKALVTIGSFLDFSFSKKSWLKNFVSEGIVIQIAGTKITLLRSQTLLNLSVKFNFVATPVSFKLRQALLQNSWLKVFLSPLFLTLNFLSRLKLWEFLYHIPNLDALVRQQLFYKTMDGTFSPMLKQFYFAVADEKMKSANGRVNYSQNYQRLTLPVSIVAMEFDSLADPAMMKQKMFDVISSDRKFFTLWNGMGHEDHFTNTKYFPQVLSAILNVC